MKLGPSNHYSDSAGPNFSCTPHWPECSGRYDERDNERSNDNSESINGNGKRQREPSAVIEQSNKKATAVNPLQHVDDIFHHDDTHTPQKENKHGQDQKEPKAEAETETEAKSVQILSSLQPTTTSPSPDSEKERRVLTGGGSKEDGINHHHYYAYHYSTPYPSSSPFPPNPENVHNRHPITVVPESGDHPKEVIETTSDSSPEQRHHYHHHIHHYYHHHFYHHHYHHHNDVPTSARKDAHQDSTTRT